uniref:Tudor domain-containing protein n=1 Tax=Steinernema glaseri TaxID=37863 RepID=A0A1I8A876_9BILA
MSSAARAYLWRSLPFVAVGGTGAILYAIYKRNHGQSNANVKVIEQEKPENNTESAATEQQSEDAEKIVDNNICSGGDKSKPEEPVVLEEDCAKVERSQESCSSIQDTLNNPQLSFESTEAAGSMNEGQKYEAGDHEVDGADSPVDSKTEDVSDAIVVEAAEAEVGDAIVADAAEAEEEKADNNTEVTATEQQSEDAEKIAENNNIYSGGDNSKPEEPVVLEEDCVKVERPQESCSSIQDILKNQQPSFDWTEAAGSIHEAQEYEAGDRVGYEDDGADSPVGSEVSADSGRASGGMACSLSPGVGDGESEMLPMYEFEIPNTLVGLIIGIRGKTIKELCIRADVKMIIRPHHNPEKTDTHQICTVEGKRDCINKCLRLLRRRFPSNRFPDLNLKPVMPPPVPCPAAEIFGSQPTNLSLPDGVRCEVVVSSMLNPGHFFVQQPTHPTFSQLQRLDRYMLGIYSQTAGIPDLPQPCAIGLLCVAPSLSGWFRAVTMAYYEDQDEVLVRYVDYGGYARLPRSDLRQIRTDLMTLPFQATECYLANVQPADGTSQWSEQANEEFQQLYMNKIVEASVIGYNVEDQIPVVELFTLNGENKSIKLDKYLLDKDLAKLADPSKVVPVLPK